MNGFAEYLSNVRKLNNIGRWANEFLHRRASVSEHSFCVTQIAQMLGIIEESYGTQIDWKLLYRKALNHDVPEALMGDVISTTKNINEQTKSALNKVEAELVDNYLLAKVPPEFRDEYRRLLSDGKDESLEGQILRYADSIDALIECLQEVQLANAKPFQEKYDTILKSINKSSLKSVHYFINEILPALKGK